MLSLNFLLQRITLTYLSVVYLDKVSKITKQTNKKQNVRRRYYELQSETFLVSYIYSNT